jgi:hypothetical protein
VPVRHDAAVGVEQLEIQDSTTLEMQRELPADELLNALYAVEL